MDQQDHLEGAVVIPAIASIEVSNLGIISSANMELSERVTFVHTGNPLGVTTLVAAIGAVGGHSVAPHLLESSDREATIKARWRSPQIVIHAVSRKSICSSAYGEQIRLGDRQESLSRSEDSLIKLHANLYQVGADQCIAIDKDVFGTLSSFHLAECFRLIESSSCQVIAFLSALILPSLPLSLRETVRYELAEDPVAHHQSTLIPFTTS